VVLLVAVALLPVFVFLLLLVAFDSFKLVSTRTLARAIAAGVAAALAAWAVHDLVFARISSLDDLSFSRYVAPVSEETLKALFVLYLLHRRRIGFLVDAAIVGFAIGAGFAVVENIEYLLDFSNARVWVWVARGFGTAMLHASTTAVVAVGAKALWDRYPDHGLRVIAVPWIGAVALHALFNYARVSPVVAAAMPMVVLPLAVLLVFNRSERMTHEWVGDGLDLDVQLLQLVRSGEFGETRLGRYLFELRTRFPGLVVADMFCLLQLELELGIRAKGLLMARQAGLDVPVDETISSRLEERAYLRKTIGPVGLLALRPLQVTTNRDDWHGYLLTEAAGGTLGTSGTSGTKSKRLS
jgi:RsiW-degrading membrane proteinase PrsW (M82 family)